MGTHGRLPPSALWSKFLLPLPSSTLSPPLLSFSHLPSFFPLPSHFPSPFLLSSPFPLPSLYPSPSRSHFPTFSQNPARGLGSVVRFPSKVWGGPQPKLNLTHFQWKIWHLVKTILVTFMKNHTPLCLRQNTFPKIFLVHLLQRWHRVDAPAGTLHALSHHQWRNITELWLVANLQQSQQHLDTSKCWL